jgi:hypothetical protein
MNTPRDEKNQILRDYMTTQRRMDALNIENHRQDDAIELLVGWVVFGILVTVILLVLAYRDEIDCWFNPGTDTCVQCIDDCLEPAVKPDFYYTTPSTPTVEREEY